jgi:hypothetical protein
MGHLYHGYVSHNQRVYSLCESLWVIWFWGWMPSLVFGVNPQPVVCLQYFFVQILRHSSYSTFSPLHTHVLLFLSACGLAFIPIFADYDGQYIQIDLTLRWSCVLYIYMRPPKTEVCMHFQMHVRCLFAGFGAWSLFPVQGSTIWLTCAIGMCISVWHRFLLNIGE